MQEPNIRAAGLVQSGFKAQTAGDWSSAEAAYLHALRLQPQQADALQLLGLLVARRGDTAAAEQLMRRSLQVRAAQPHVWNNLGNLLERSGRLVEAEAAFDQALLLHPAYADAHYNRAGVLHALGRLPAAMDAVRKALQHAAVRHPSLLQLQAQIEADGGDIEAALQTVADALQLAPERAALVHNQATLLHRSHRYAEALAAHERALALGLNVADAHYNRGNTLQSLGRHADAVRAYRDALALQPAHQLALFDVSRLRWRMGDPDFDAELNEATEAEPDSPIGPGLQGQLLLRAGRHADAAAAFRQALVRAPQAAGFHDGLARCLVQLGAVAEGLSSHQRAVELAPTDAGVLAHQAAGALTAGQSALASTAALAACRLAPDNQFAQAVQGLVWRLQGDAREHWLNDDQRLVSVHDLPAPPGFADMADFNAKLANALLALHTDQQAPVDQTLRVGTQSLGNLFGQRHPLVDALKAVMAQAVSAYILALPDDGAHPFLRRRSSGWRFADAWSSRLRSGGFHTNHVHSEGWISSVYYVAVPPVSADLQRQEGWLQFGQPDFEIALPDAVRRRVQPRVGRLVLFPSMFWHGTTPFADDQDRLTVAFDVLPCT